MQGACSPLSAPQARWALHHKHTLEMVDPLLQCIRIRFFESSCGFIFLVCVLGSDFGGNWWNSTCFPPVKLQGVRQTQVHLGIWCNFYSSYAASVSSLSGALLARKQTYMLSIVGTTTKMNINSKVYSWVYGDTSKCCHGDTSTCCHGDTSNCCHHYTQNSVLRTSK